jgi:hypothetical protein
MKTLYKLLVLFSISILHISCEDEIKVDLNTALPKLVIDASIRWEKGTLGNEQKIKLTTTTSYYSAIIPTVSGAIVSITNSSNTIFTFTEIPNTGEYLCTDFVPVINETYTLMVQYAGQIYTSSEKLLATPNIEDIQQTVVQGFGGDEIQVKFFYQDNGSEINKYLIGVKNSTLVVPEYGVIKDEFFQGNQMFGFYTNEDLAQGHILSFSLTGISGRYYNYMNKLLSISGSSGGSPFATPPATLRGNIINTIDDANYPLGFFSVSEIDKLDYIVQ